MKKFILFHLFIYNKKNQLLPPNNPNKNFLESNSTSLTADYILSF